MMSSTSAVLMPVRSASARSTAAPSCCGWMSESAPLPALPMPRGVLHASMISASVMVVAPLYSLSARRHADGAVKPHVLAVEVAVGDHGVRKLRIFLGPAEPARERHRRAQRRLHVLCCARQQGRVEDAGQDGVAADAFL